MAMNNPRQTWERVTWLGYVAVMVLFGVQTALTAPSNAGTVFEVIGAGMVLWLLKTLPLWLFFIPMLRARVRALSWFGFLILLYLPFVVMSAFRDPQWLGVALTCAVIVLFFGNAYWVRAIKRNS